METRKSKTTPQSTATRLVCPRCGGPVVAKIAFGSNFCGVRTTAECERGCKWTLEEQQTMDHAASDEMFA